MKKRMVWMMAFWMMAVVLVSTSGAADRVMKMSTTTSTESSGLLDVLLPAFEKKTGIKIEVIAKGTGAAIRDGQDGNVDVIFVHDKEREEAFVSEGYGTKRYAVMHNDFVILGPPTDPAKAKDTKDAAQVFSQIAKTESIFVSRGDDSGTHAKEQELWKATGLPLKTETKTYVKDGKDVEMKFTHPEGLGKWYQSIGQGMGKTLTFTDEKQGYTLSDRGTFIAYKYGKDKTLGLDIVCEGDSRLFNPYGVIPVDPKRHAHAKYDMALAFAEWLVSPEGQAVIANYQMEGKQLFFPDAIPDAK